MYVFMDCVDHRQCLLHLGFVFIYVVGIDPKTMGTNKRPDCTESAVRTAAHSIHILSEIDSKSVRGFVPDA